MAGAGLIQIKRRIKSITNTKKITKAMGLVATSKLRKTRKQLSFNDKYFNSLKDLTESLISSIEEDDNSIYFKANNQGPALYILIASDTGLCGGFNGNIVNYFMSQSVNAENAEVMVVGQKGLSYLKRYNQSTLAEYVDIPDVPTVKEAKIIYEHAIRLYKEGSISEINVIYAEFISPVKQNMKKAKLLPMDKIEGKKANIIAEPNIEEVVEGTLDIYLKSYILNCMLNSKASEQSARMTAMDGATNNASDLLDALNTKYNRIRQTAITQEISEIVGGAEAQK
ncbi:ATP synthase F1 subunit gamma [Clostridium intestinale]|uniref:ATP synthase gamma chain n=2 Tax=Clostridium intestinale TaxID=36845 RepID=U2NSR5_9CLOT|nr:ATP synthase F1 subunit gamma [Clostridium intestinale]ERK32223.1 F0F1 ATP synthase subunit gamma [Clostridium intestinale URNW]QLY79229.1 F0F1 ATP synthase subunit gamma [Clostridium intestinale]